MSRELARRIHRLEGNTAGTVGPYALLPAVCSSTEEWFERIRLEKEGKGHYVEGPPPRPGQFVRKLIWVPDHG